MGVFHTDGSYTNGEELDTELQQIESTKNREEPVNRLRRIDGLRPTCVKVQSQKRLETVWEM